MFNFNDMKTKKKVLLGICAPMIMLFGLAGVSLYGISSVISISKLVDHTHIVLEKSASVVEYAVDMETGMRGFLLAGKEEFLDPYKYGEKKSYSSINELQTIVSDNPAQVERLEEAGNILKEWQKEVTEPYILMRRDVGSSKTMNDLAQIMGEARGKTFFDRFRAVMQEFHDEEAKLLVIRDAEAHSAASTTYTLIGLSVAFAVGLGLWLAWFIGRAIANPLLTTTAAVIDLAKGKEVTIPGMDRKDELGELSRALQEIVVKAAADLRTRSALDTCQTNVMVADADYNVVYANSTMNEMLKGNETKLRIDLPNFSADTLIGTNIDTFHKSPSHQRKILDGMRSSTETSLEIGGLNFDLIVSPITNASGDRVGTVVEWEDVTEKRAFAEESNRAAAENLRIKTALDSCQTNVMVADAEYNVVYVNETMAGMLKTNELDMKKDLPKFDAASIVGTSIDTFHKNPIYQRNMLDGLSSTVETALEIGSKNYDLVVSPINDDKGVRVGTVVEWEDVTEKLALAKEESRISAENLRIKSALDSCQTNVMVADADYNIVYVNDTMNTMLTRNDADMKKDLPLFDSRTIIGTNIDTFHKNPAHQRGMLNGLSNSVETALEIGGKNYDLVVSPISDDKGVRVGTVVEWEDITEKLAQQTEERRVAAENTRIKSALDSCKTNVMVADASYDIVYVNETMTAMLRSNESDMKKDLPKFDAASIVGTNIDTFHKNPTYQRNLLDGLSSTVETALEIGGMNYDLVVSPINDDQGARIGTVVEWEDVTEKLARETEERRISNENSRIKSALDNCTTNIMVSDADYNIVYINGTMQEMLISNDADMKKDLPQFDSRNIIGVNIDTFHKNPAHQRGALDRLTGAFDTSIVIGGRTYDLIASPVLSDEGDRIGTVVEWNDATAERNIEREIDEVVTAAVAGDFDKKLELNGKEGFMLKLSEAINGLSDTVSNAMEDVGTSLSALSEGNLTRRISKNYDGLFDELKTNANNTADQLTEIVTDITTASSEVANAAQEINTGTMDLSQRTEQQASNLEETAAAMEEMASTVKQNAENAQQANQLSVSARDTATKGGEVVSEVVDAMSRIEDSSQKISDIIGVIDEIAFQTNLLALNAAVEAARAGDAGKGFAVVAAEVGTLAQRSSQAAKDIKGLINDSGSQVQDGVKLVGHAGESLTEIVDSIKRLSDIVSEIAAASNEQSTSIEEINRSVAQMDEMTQQNSALVEENAAASRTLQEQSVGMRDRISFFQLEEAGRGKKIAASNGSSNGKAVRSPVPVSTTPSMPAAAKVGKANGSAAAAEDWGEF